MRTPTLPMPTSRALRLGSGLVLWVYVASHLFNHALGLVSLGAAEQGLRVALVVWHSALGTLLLYCAFAVHLVLAMRGCTSGPRCACLPWSCCGSARAWPFPCYWSAMRWRRVWLLSGMGWCRSTSG